MATLLKLGLADHGRPLALEEFLAAEGQEGYRYELIGGKVYVSPTPNPPENWAEEWLGELLHAYARAHPEVINYVSGKCRVFVPRAEEVTAPEPDLAAYHAFPRLRGPQGLRWDEVSPVLVVKVLVEGDPDKDLDRNVELYRQVPSLQEYWILDGRQSVTHPRLLVYRRRDRRRWRNSLLSKRERPIIPDCCPAFPSRSTLRIDRREPWGRRWPRS